TTTRTGTDKAHPAIASAAAATHTRAPARQPRPAGRGWQSAANTPPIPSAPETGPPPAPDTARTTAVPPRNSAPPYPSARGRTTTTQPPAAAGRAKAATPPARPAPAARQENCRENPA